MTVNVSAVVLAHDEPEMLTRVLDQLAKQSVAPNRILIVDTSKEKALASHGFETLKLSPKTNFASAIDQAVKHLAQDGYLWILHDDSAPDVNALENLLQQIELSPSLAVVGPKQVDWENPKLIRQLGLTLTKSGKLFSRIRGEFDQGQHDAVQDVMAVGTAGALINLDKYKELAGFDKSAPELASDVDFSIRARLSGGRVAVAPGARLAHAMLAMNGRRATSWLGGSPAKAIREAEFHLALSYANFVVFFFGWLLLIPFALLNSLVLLVRKRAQDVPAEISAAISTFFGIGSIFASRSKIAKTTTLKLSTLRGLRASRQEVKSSNQRAKDQEVSKLLLEAHARGENDQELATSNSGLVSSGAIWFALALVGINFLWFPTNFATTGSGVIPLSSNWLEIFLQAGQDNQSLGLGFSGSSDPFVWVLALLSSTTFFAPSLAITLVLFLAFAIAFIGFFRLAGLLSQSNSVRITAGLSYALWPSLTISIAETRISQVIAILILPWLVHSLARVAGLASGSLNSIGSTWSQVGLSAILLALLTASSPALGLLLIALIVLLGLVRIKSLVPLLFSTGLTAVMFWPIALERWGSNPLTILLDPGVATAQALEANWKLPFFGFGFDSLQLGLFIAAPIVLFALLALLAPRLQFTASLWVVAALSLATAFVAAGVSFNFGELVSIGLDLKGILALFGLVLILLVAHLANNSSPFRVVSLSLIAIVGLAPAAFAAATNPPVVKYSDGRSVPSIVQADSDAGLEVRTLEITEEEGFVSAQVIQGPGIKLEKLSTGFQISNSSLASQSLEYQQLGQLVANLVSANGADVLTPLENFGIGYILVNPADRDLQMALDSTRGLESIGETDFGQLWKVQSVSASQNATAENFPISKIVFLATFAFYLLLALPTGASRKKNGKESEIFVDVEESN